jgi:hypothetical protein
LKLVKFHYETIMYYIEFMKSRIIFLNFNKKNSSELVLVKLTNQCNFKIICIKKSIFETYFYNVENFYNQERKLRLSEEDAHLRSKGMGS